MQCAAHPDQTAVDSCAACKKGLCEACATFELEGKPCCERCGRAYEAQARELGAGLLAFVGVGYLGALAIGVVLFKARPFVGGMAAIVAIALGRVLQVLIPSPAVSRRR